MANRTTQRQKKVAKLIVENMSSTNPLNKGEILADVGYSIGMQKQPSVVIESDGVQNELKLLGFTEENAKLVVGKILNDEEVEPNARLKAADMTFKVHGTYAPEKSLNINVEAIVQEKDLSLAQSLLEQRTNKSIEKGSGGSSPPSNGIVPVAVGGEVQDKK